MTNGFLLSGRARGGLLEETARGIRCILMSVTLFMAYPNMHLLAFTMTRTPRPWKKLTDGLMRIRASHEFCGKYGKV